MKESEPEPHTGSGTSRSSTPSPWLVVLQSWGQRSTSTVGRAPLWSPTARVLILTPPLPAAWPQTRCLTSAPQFPHLQKEGAVPPPERALKCSERGLAHGKHPTPRPAAGANPVSDSYTVLHGYERLSVRYLPGPSHPLLETGGVGVRGERWENYTQPTIEMGVIWPQQCFVWLI